MAQNSDFGFWGALSFLWVKIPISKKSFFLGQHPDFLTNMTRITSYFKHTFKLVRFGWMPPAFCFGHLELGIMANKKISAPQKTKPLPQQIIRVPNTWSFVLLQRCHSSFPRSLGKHWETWVGPLESPWGGAWEALGGRWEAWEVGLKV